jgi:hypothetical protein
MDQPQTDSITISTDKEDLLIKLKEIEVQQLAF